MNPRLTECPLCHGTGWEFVDYNTVRECSCGLIEQRRNKNKLRFAAVPETYKDTTLRDMRIKCYSEGKEVFKKCAELVKWYLDNLEENEQDGKGLYFWSTKKGSGKTMLAAAIANELMNVHKRYVKFATSLDILDEIRSTYDRSSGENESKLISDLIDAEFLIIDDFGTERVNDWTGEKFYQIVNKRYTNRKVTIYTSNYDPLTLKYDDRITNRIIERNYIVHFPEESVREYKAHFENERRYDWKKLESEAFTGE